jgi:hypothetical protein
VEELLPRLDQPFPDAGQFITSLYGTCRLSHAEMAAAASLGAGEWRQWQDSLNRLCQSPGQHGV